MDFLQAFITGTVQGITEWLPISSEGINSLILTQVFGSSLTAAVMISIWLHIGTLFAAAIYLRKDITRILRERGKEFNFLVIATIAGVIVAAPLMLIGLEWFVATGKGIMILIGVLLIITGIVQLSAKRRYEGSKQITMIDAVIAGIAQGLAILPGLSRSGLTVSALLFRNYSPTSAIKLSFLMSIPAIAIAGAWTLLQGVVSATAEAATALATSFIFGLITIAVLLKVAERVNFSCFCFLIGALAISFGLI
jgi:undecaprenyl-diphosphatase